MKIFFIFLIAFLIVLIHCSFAQPVPLNSRDTLWTLRTQVSKILRFSHDSKQVMSVDNSRNILLFETETGKGVMGAIPKIGMPYFTPDDRGIIGIGTKSPVFYNRDSRNFVSRFESDKDSIDYLYLSSDGNYVVTSKDSSFCVWNVQTGKIENKKTYNSTRSSGGAIVYTVKSIKITNDNRYIILNIIVNDFSGQGNEYYYLRVLDRQTLDLVYEFYGVWGWGDFAISNDSKTMAIIYVDIINSNEQYTRIIDLNNGNEKFRLKVDQYNMTGIKFSSNDRYLLISHIAGNQMIEVWDLEKKSLSYTYICGGPYTCMDLSPNDKYLVAGRFEMLYLYHSIYTNIVQEIGFIENFVSYPNPTDSKIDLKFGVKNFGNINIELFNEIGQLIKPIESNYHDIGNYSLKLDVQNITSGFYFIKFSQNTNTQTFKIQIVK